MLRVKYTSESTRNRERSVLILVVFIMALLATNTLRAEFPEYSQYELFTSIGASTLFKPQDVAVNEETGEVFVLDHEVGLPGKVVVFGPYPKYEPRREIARSFFSSPKAVAIRGERVYLSGEDSIYGDGVGVFGTDGTFIRFFRIAQSAGARPRGVAVDRSGAVYVIEDRATDIGLGDVLHKFDPNGRLVVTVNGSSLTGRFGRLRDVAVNPETSQVYLTDDGDDLEDEQFVHLVSFFGPSYRVVSWDIEKDWGFPKVWACHVSYVGVDGAGVAHVGVCDRWIVRTDETGGFRPPNDIRRDETGARIFGLCTRFYFDQNTGDVLKKKGGCTLEPVGSQPSAVDLRREKWEGPPVLKSSESFRTVDAARRIFMVHRLWREVFIFTPTDADGDGLLDEWETHGLDVDNDGIVDLDLPAMGADPRHKDLFLELDWLPYNPPRQHAIREMKAAFAAAPVDAGKVLNPDGQPGINLWVDTGKAHDVCPLEDRDSSTPGSCNDGIDNGGDGVSDRLDPECDELEMKKLACAVEDVDTSAPGDCMDGIDNDGDGDVDGEDADCRVGDNLGGGNQILTDTDGDDQPGPVCFDIDTDSFLLAKQENFDDARRIVFRYAINAYSTDGVCPVTPLLGQAWGLGGANMLIHTNDRAGTYTMHEFGHLLNIQHGGDEDVGGKPNYLSAVTTGRITQFDPGLTEDGGIAGSCGDGVDNGKDKKWDRDEPECRRTILDFSPPRYPGGRGSAPYPTLKEDELTEDTVFDRSDAFNFWVRWGEDGLPVFAPVDTRVNWNGDEDPPYEIVLGYSMDLNRNGVSDDTLHGFDDWSNIAMSHRLKVDFQTANATPTEEPELTEEELETQRVLMRGCDRADIDCDGDVDTDDLEHVIAKRNTNAFGAADPHDLDADGVITALDARQLVTICTRTRCATE